MRRRGSRELNIFNMSALDLFASAMGAFILVALILFPYYLKSDSAIEPAVVDALEARIADLQQQAQQSAQKAAQLEQELERTVKFALLGITSRANSFVVLIDMSGSMNAYTGTMVETVGRLITPMSPAQQVQLIGFKGSGATVELPVWQPNRGMAVMSPGNKRQAMSFVRALTADFGGGTPTHLALEEALNYSSEAIILMTDGAPNGDPNQIIDQITRLNGGSKEIHAIALGDYRSKPILIEFLEKLAEKNDGGFLGVSN